MIDIKICVIIGKYTVIVIKYPVSHLFSFAFVDKLSFAYLAFIFIIALYRHGDDRAESAVISGHLHCHADFPELSENKPYIVKFLRIFFKTEFFNFCLRHHLISERTAEQKLRFFVYDSLRHSSHKRQQTDTATDVMIQNKVDKAVTQQQFISSCGHFVQYHAVDVIGFQHIDEHIRNVFMSCFKIPAIIQKSFRVIARTVVFHCKNHLSFLNYDKFICLAVSLMVLYHLLLSEFRQFYKFHSTHT